MHDNFPSALLKVVIENTYLHETIKHDVWKWESAAEPKKYAQDRYMGTLASLVGHIVRVGEHAS